MGSGEAVRVDGRCGGGPATCGARGGTTCERTPVTWPFSTRKTVPGPAGRAREAQGAKG